MSEKPLTNKQTNHQYNCYPDIFLYVPIEYIMKIFFFKCDFFKKTFYKQIKKWCSEEKIIGHENIAPEHKEAI